MARQSKLRIESLLELKKTFAANPETEFCLLVRGERKVEMEIDAKVIEQLQKLLQKNLGHHDEDRDY